MRLSSEYRRSRRCAAGGGRRILGLGLERHPEAVGQRLQRRLEVQPLGLHHERERVARGLAAEAVVVLLVGPDVERGAALVVKRAQPEVAVDAGAAQLGPRRDQRDHVDRVEHAVAGVGGVAAHGAKATGTLSSSNARMQKRSVMPGEIVGDPDGKLAVGDRVRDLLADGRSSDRTASGSRARSWRARGWPPGPGRRART